MKLTTTINFKSFFKITLCALVIMQLSQPVWAKGSKRKSNDDTRSFMDVDLYAPYQGDSRPVNDTHTLQNTDRLGQTRTPSGNFGSRFAEHSCADNLGAITAVLF